jgi:nucleoid DNA-binding protein
VEIVTGKKGARKRARSVGRAQLEKRLRGKGFSRRKAKQAVNTVLETMMEGLQRDGEVEFPLGKLKLVQHRHRQQEGKFLGATRTIYRRRWTVVHEMDERGKKLLNPPPIPKRPRFVLPPRPSEKVEEKQVPKKVTARGRHKRVPIAETPMEKSHSKARHQIVLPPRPSRTPPGPIRLVLAPLVRLEPVPRPGNGNSGKLS